MGYYIRLVESTFAVPETTEVLDVLKAMNTDPDMHELKRGGSSTKDGWTARWFSWMPENYHDEVDNVEQVFGLLGFETRLDGGMVHLIDYDNKTGQEDLFLAAVAPFVAEGSFIEFHGEDDAMWRYVVRDGRLATIEPTITWN